MAKLIIKDGVYDYIIVQNTEIDILDLKAWTPQNNAVYKLRVPVSIKEELTVSLINGTMVTQFDVDQTETQFFAYGGKKYCFKKIKAHIIEQE